uniref:Consortin, connexin sorting protein n=1 Tax=Suricata suricatta TaxID=37032 RepID=A0A673SW15_SURSU
MDDSETPTYNLQIEPQDGCHPGDGVASTVTLLAVASDENENQLDGDGQEGLSPGTSAMGRPEACEQDSLNNNESCTPSCGVAVCENSADTSYESPQDGQASVGKDKTIPGKRSSRTKRGTTKKIAQDSRVLFPGGRL